MQSGKVSAIIKSQLTIKENCLITIRSQNDLKQSPVMTGNTMSNIERVSDNARMRTKNINDTETRSYMDL